jgi:hypothetical protein
LYNSAQGKWSSEFEAEGHFLFTVFISCIFALKFLFQMVYQIEILNPETQSLLESLARLQFIRMRVAHPAGADFLTLLEHLRSQNAEGDLSEEAILKEVEAVRSSRHERTGQGNH